MRKASLLLASVAVCLLLASGVALAAFPGSNGKIAFLRAEGINISIYTINPDGSGEKRVVADVREDSSVSWSPAGKRLAFSRGGDGIFTVNPDGGGEKRITNPPGNPSRGQDFDPAWSPSGKRIAFYRRTDTTGGATTNGIFSLRTDGSDLTRLTRGSYDHDPQWSPKGGKIAFSRPKPSRYDIFVMNADGTDEVNLTDSRGVSEYGASWSPNGRKIVFLLSPRFDDADIWVMNPDGSGARRVFDSPDHYEGFPAFSPNGEWITFETSRGAGWTKIYKVRLDGTGLRRVSSGTTEDTMPDWQPLP